MEKEKTYAASSKAYSASSKAYSGSAKSSGNTSSWRTTPAHWETLKEFYDPVNRRDHASVQVGPCILVFGGKSGDRILNDMVYLYPGYGTGGALPQTTLPMTGRHGHVACALDKEMFIIMHGGQTEEGVTNEVYVWQLKANPNLELEPYPHLIEGDGPRRVHHTAHMHMSMYVFCGKDEKGRDSNQVWRLTLGTPFRWELCDVPDPKPRARSGHCSVMTTDEKVYIFGGLCGDTGEYLNDMWMFDFDKLRWEEQTPLTEGRQRGYPSGVANAAAQEREGKIYIFGGQGQDVKFFDDLWVYDIEERTYRLAVTGNPPPQKVYHSAHFVSTTFVIWGGEKDSDPETEKTEIVHLLIYDLIFTKYVSDEEEEYPSIIGDKKENMKMIYDENEEEDVKPVKKKKSLKKDESEFYYGVKGKEKEKDIKEKKTSKKYAEEEKSAEEGILNENGNNTCRKLYIEKILVDVIFNVEGQEFSGHKCILAASCKFFEELLKGVSGSQISKDKESEVIQVRDLKASTFKALLEFIYCIPFSFNQQLFLDLLQFAVKWKYSELQNICENTLARKLTEGNFLLVAKETENLPTKILEKGIVNFIATNVESISQRNDLDSLPKTLLLQVLSHVRPKISYETGRAKPRYTYK